MTRIKKKKLVSVGKSDEVRKDLLWEIRQVLRETCENPVENFDDPNDNWYCDDCQDFVDKAVLASRRKHDDDVAAHEQRRINRMNNGILV